MQPGSSISDLLHSLDATTYFFVSSGIFIVVTAVLYFGLGVWLGQILWGRFKRRFRHSEEAIEAYKGEVALLKRRLAEQVTRPAPGSGPSPLQAIAFKATTQVSVVPVAKEVVPVQISARALVPLPRGKPFTLWTEPDWHPAEIEPMKLHPGRGFTLWTQASVKTGRIVPGPLQVQEAVAMPLFAPMEIFMAPRSRAFCLWTDDRWVPPVVKPAPLPRSAAFTLWTLPSFRPVSSGWRLPSRAYTIWTLPDWAPNRQSWPPTRSARAFTVWTESEWPEHLKLPRSSAFTIWTEPGWIPETSQASPLPASAAWSLWTGPDFEPSGYGRLPESRAFSIWTEEDWMPAPVRPLPVFKARPFSLWAEPPDPATAVRRTTAPPLPTLTLTKGPGLMVRAFAAARKALGLDEFVPPVPVPVPATRSDGSVSLPASTEPNRDPVSSVPNLPSLEPALPPSRAFTLWTESGPAPHAPVAKVAQSAAMAALIESNTTGKSASVPPVPSVSANTTPKQNPHHGALRQQPLNLEPLVVPESSAQQPR
jgi:hypothetical protein